MILHSSLIILSVLVATCSPVLSLCAVGDGKLNYLRSTTAKCIDGSKPAYYIRNGSGIGVAKWNIFFEGGGWCYGLDACLARSHTHLGTSIGYPPCLHQMSYYQSLNEAQNPLMYNWNTVHVKYCDGSSYGGDSTVAHNGQLLYFKGKINRDATIAELLSEHNMSAATDVVLSGCSAGGLGIYLGLDHMATTIIKSSTANTRVYGLSDSGFFMNHTGDTQWRERRTNNSDTPIITGVLNYPLAMRHVYTFMNISAGAHAQCTAQHAHDNSYSQAISSTSSVATTRTMANNHRREIAVNIKDVLPSLLAPDSDCIFASALVPHIVTPLFVLQPQFDQWQIWNVVGKPYDVKLVNSFGRRLVNLVTAGLLSRPQHGAYFDACTHHCTSCSSGEYTWHGSHVLAAALGSNTTSAASTLSSSSPSSFSLVSSTDMSRSNHHSNNVQSTHTHTPAGAFQLWWSDMRDNYQQIMASSSQNNHEQSRHVYVQQGSYPCKSCCRCHA